MQVLRLDCILKTLHTQLDGGPGGLGRTGHGAILLAQKRRRQNRECDRGNNRKNQPFERSQRQVFHIKLKQNLIAEPSILLPERLKCGFNKIETKPSTHLSRPADDPARIDFQMPALNVFGSSGRVRSAKFLNS